ncbi:ABC transporter permease subunit [Marinomonas posidonica]|uniref:ABC-type transporter, integral membrane subunit n=1 Tax=Marinomonas posidonica (strain CECT 7376 / NCIMB 14433 / IVIA-Po-181) TaxID=491952 RepID=F6CT07_MARPP|nr:ABC transporter permease subunit [Marinomonas posidonica]AEF55065.1 ABC-type transporter, integral membrane subunit [Marinomonas posidonica IVIA-Po-181]
MTKSFDPMESVDQLSRRSKPNSATKTTILSRFTNLFAAGPVKPGESYGAPGQGKSLAISLLTTFLLIFIWYLATQLQWVKPLFLPSPVAVVQRFWEVATQGFANATLIEHTGWSMMRVFSAFVLALLTAVPIGIFMGVNRVVRGLFDPIIEFYRPLPPLAYLPLVIIWLGIGEVSKVVLIYLAIFAPMALSARAGVKSVAIEQIHAAYSMGATRWQVIRHIILINALPEILTGMRIGIGFGWTTLVAAEMVAAQAGLGFMVLNAAEFLVTDVVIMGIIVIGIIAYLFDLFMRYLERKLVPWKGR